MVASKNKRSEIADSIKKLMDALNDEVLPSADDLRKHGWITVADYAKATNRHPSNCKKLLDSGKNIEKRKALSRGQPTMMYRVKKK
jgi:outer membrane PBP1 activator LpoA protein